MSGRSKAHIRSPKQEQEIAARLGGQATVASGALDQKGDVRVKHVLRVEAKTTSAKSFSVTRDMLRKIETAALPYNELPAMEIEFLDKSGKPVGSVCVVPKYVLEIIGMEWKEQTT